MKKLILFLTLLLSIAGYAQTPEVINIGGAPNDGTGDNLRTMATKINTNFGYMGSFKTNEYADNVSAIKSNIDIVGPGTVTLTNGSATVTGTGTNFTDATAGKGLSYWFGFHVTDAAGTNYYIFLSSITNATTATISWVYTEDQFFTAGAVATATFPGTTGTYTYKIVRNRAKGLFSNALGNNALARDFGTAFGGLTTAAGTTSFALGAQTLATGSRSFAGGWGSFSSNLDKRVLAAGQAAFNWSQNFTTQTVGHGALALGSAILGGRDHNIPSDATNSAILGGNAIKVGTGVINTVHFPKVRIGLGTSATMVTDNTNTNILARDATTGEIEIRDASTLGGTVTASNGLIKVGNDIQLGGSIVSPTTLDIGQFTDNKFSVTAGPVAGAQGFLFDIVGDSFDGGRFLLRSTGSLSTKFAGVNAQLGVARIEGSNAVGNFSLAMDGENATAKFIDNRNVKLGLQYDAAGYETTDLTLISRGFANSNYWKTSGTTIIPGTFNSVVINTPLNSGNVIAIKAGDGVSNHVTQEFSADDLGGIAYYLTGVSTATNYTQISVTPGQFQLLSTSDGGATHTQLLASPSGGLVVSDTRATKTGIKTSATGYVTDPRSYADKEYVDNRTLEGSAALDFPSVTGPNTSDLTITVTGASVGDPVSLGIPPTAMVAGATPTVYLAFVSAANTVTIRLICPATGPAVNPPSATFNVTVHKP